MMDSMKLDGHTPAVRPAKSIPEPEAVVRDELEPLATVDIGPVSGPHCAKNDLWSAVRDLFEGTDLRGRFRSVLDSVGADRVFLSERFVDNSEDRRRDHVKLHYPIFDPVDSTDNWATLMEAYNSVNRNITGYNCQPPRFTSPGSVTNKLITARMPFSVTTLPSDERRFCEMGISCLNDCLDFYVRDMALVPLSGGEQGEPIKFLVFTAERLFKEAEAFRGAALAIIGMVGLEQAKQACTGRMRYCLSDREIEIYSWTIKGKTVEEISIITSFSVQSVRYSLYRVRDLLGYATVAQAMVHVAKVYDITP